jgi:hypothetical protein
VLQALFIEIGVQFLACFLYVMNENWLLVSCLSPLFFPSPSRVEKKVYIIVVGLNEEVLFFFIIVCCCEVQPLTFNCHMGQNFTTAAVC